MSAATEEVRTFVIRIHFLIVIILIFALLYSFSHYDFANPKQTTLHAIWNLGSMSSFPHVGHESHDNIHSLRHRDVILSFKIYA